MQILQKFTAKNSKILQKITAFTAFIAKNVGALRWKLFFFTAIYRNSYINFWSNLDPGNYENGSNVAIVFNTGSQSKRWRRSYKPLNKYLVQENSSVSNSKGINWSRFRERFQLWWALSFSCKCKRFLPWIAFDTSHCYLFAVNLTRFMQIYSVKWMWTSAKNSAIAIDLLANHLAKKRSRPGTEFNVADMISKRQISMLGRNTICIRLKNFVWFEDFNLEFFCESKSYVFESLLVVRSVSPLLYIRTHRKCPPY